MEQGEVVTLAPNLRAILAPNPSPMTAEGTLTYLIGPPQSLAMIDPGPDILTHFQRLCDTVDALGKLTAVLVTHAHLDHSPLAASVAGHYDVPLYGFGSYERGRTAQMQQLAETSYIGGGEGVDHAFAPTAVLEDGAVVSGEGWTLKAHWTPGHMANHLCFEWVEAQVLFCGDLIMGWAPSLISPPDGDLEQFYGSLRKVERLGATRLYPGHGSPVDAPQARITELRAHRHSRSQSLAHVLCETPQSLGELTSKIYNDVPAHILPAAKRTLFAHLLWAINRGYCTATGPISDDVGFMATQTTKELQHLPLDAL